MWCRLEREALPQGRRCALAADATSTCRPRTRLTPSSLMVSLSNHAPQGLNSSEPKLAYGEACKLMPAFWLQPNKNVDMGDFHTFRRFRKVGDGHISVGNVDQEVFTLVKEVMVL